MQPQYIVILILATLFRVEAVKNETITRGEKALSIFQVVRFPNSVCIGTGNYNGTCYTSSECTSKGGISSGSCASGFGVCCVFTLGCGSTTSQNCSYFLSSASNQGAGGCSIQVCKCSNDICQLRIDFNTFVIAGPNSLTVTQFKTAGGGIAGGGKKVTTASQCLTDTFSVTGPGGSVPPVICGSNSGQHVLVDASNNCNKVTFQLGQAGIGTSIPSRQWNLKISQISCFDANKAPSGCTQYYYGNTQGTVQSFNFINSQQLAYQHQQICIRREKGYCRICWSAAADADFAVSGIAVKALTLPSKCCGYGTTGMTTSYGFDCVMIPGASNTAKVVKGNTICGKSKGLGTADGVGSKTICSYQTPFQLTFLSDAYNVPTQGTKGFKLSFWETTC